MKHAVVVLASGERVAAHGTLKHVKHAPKAPIEDVPSHFALRSQGMDVLSHLPLASAQGDVPGDDISMKVDARLGT